MGLMNWFTGYIFKGFKLGGKGILSVFKYIFSYIIPFIQYCAQTCFNYLFRFDTIKKYINIDQNILEQAKMILSYLKKMIPSINQNYKIFLTCLVLYFIIILSLIFNFLTIFLNPNCVYVFIFQNLLLLISFFFYYGSEEFFNILLTSDNLQIFIIIFFIMIVSIYVPKKNIIISIFLSVILIITNIFLLANLNFFENL